MNRIAVGVISPALLLLALQACTSNPSGTSLLAECAIVVGHAGNYDVCQAASAGRLAAVDRFIEGGRIWRAAKRSRPQAWHEQREQYRFLHETLRFGKQLMWER